MNPNKSYIMRGTTEYFTKSVRGIWYVLLNALLWTNHGWRIFKSLSSAELFHSALEICLPYSPKGWSAWQSMTVLSKYLSNREQWYETILQDSVACRECCWPWSHLSKCGNTLGCLLPLHHSNMNWKKRNPRPLNKPIFSEELLVDGSWWRKDFDFCSFNSHLSSMCVQKGGISWRQGDMLGHCSPYSHFIFPMSMSHSGGHLQIAADNSLRQSGLWSLFPCVACMVLWVYLWLWSTMKFTLELV